MEFRQVVTFGVLAQKLSFSQTATHLGYVQSTVSHQIQSLETELGVPLFDRLGNQITLTDAGRRFLVYAEQLLSLMDEAQHVVASDTVPRGTVTISAPETLCTYRLPPILAQFRQNYPQVRLHFVPQPDGYLVDTFSRRMIDLALIVDEPFQDEQLHIEPVVFEEVLLLAYPGHRLVNQGDFEFSDLQHESVLLTEVGCPYRAAFEKDLKTNGVRLHMPMTFHSAEAIKQCTMAGLGLAVLPAVAVQNELKQGQLVALPWGGGNTPLFTQIAWHKSKWIFPAMQAFIEAMHAVAA